MVGNLWNGAWFNGTLEDYLEDEKAAFKVYSMRDYCFFFGVSFDEAREDKWLKEHLDKQWEEMDKQKFIQRKYGSALKSES